MANRPDATPDTVPADPNAATVTSGAASSPLGPPADARAYDDHPASRDYELGAELGRGGMGRVLRARDRRLGREVAIKELIRPGVEARRRFEREARITALLQHPAIVPVYEVVTDGTSEPYYTMRLVGGTTLSDRIAAASSTERRALVRNVLTVAEAMAYAHGQRIIHRDLKASNVIVGDLGETVVIDWGLAKRIGEDDAAAPDAGPARYTDVRPEDDLTVAGAIMGTPAYMPPEQANGDAIDARADVYAIGAMLYHTLAGAMPYSGRTSREILAEVVAGPPPPLLSRLPDVPRDLAAIVTRAMEREPADRYSTARELAADLSRYMNGQLVASHDYAPRELLTRWVRKHRAAVTVAAIAFTLAAVGGTFAVRNVIAARDHARAERAIAETERAHAVDARNEATARADDAILASARAEVATDPRAALQHLQSLSAGASQWTLARPLIADALARGIATPIGHIDDVTSGAVTADGTIIVAGASGFLVGRSDGPTPSDVEDADAPQLAQGGVAAPSHPQDSLAAVARDGSARAIVDLAPGVLAAHPDTRTVYVFSAGSPRPVLVPASTRALAVTPGGSSLILVSDTDVQTLDVITGAKRVLGASPTGGGAWLARTSGDGTLVLVDRGPSTRAYRLDGAPTTLPDELWDAATTADGHWLAYKTQAGIALRDPQNHTRIIDKQTGGGTLAFDPTARWLAWHTPSSADVRLFDLHTSRLYTLTGHSGIVKAIAFDAAGTRLASASDDGTVRVHDLTWIDLLGEPFTDDGPSSVVTTFDLGEGVVWVAFAPNDQLVTATHNGRVERRPLPSIDRQPVGSAVLVSPTLRWKVQLAPKSLVATPLHATEPARTLTGVVSYWSVVGGERIWSFQPAPRWAAAAPVLVAAGDKQILRWNVATDTVDRFPLTGEPTSLAISADGAHVAALLADRTLHILTPSGPWPEVRYTAAPQSYPVFSPDNAYLALCGTNVQLISMADGKHLSNPTGSACAFSASSIAIGGPDALHLCSLPDLSCHDLADSANASAIRIARSGRIVAQLGEGVVATWDSPSSPRRILGRLRGAISDLDLSPDGTTLVTASLGPEVVLWDIPSSTSRALRGPLRSVDEVWLEDQTVGVSDPWAIHRFADSLPRDESGLRAAITTALR